MAIIKIENATVDRLITDKGLAVSTTYMTKAGDERKEKFTVWFPNAGFNIGDTVNVEGLFSVKVDKFTNNQGEEISYAQVSVNNADVKKTADSNLPF